MLLHDLEVVVDVQRKNTMKIVSVLKVPVE